MSGILDSKTRILDTIITLQGRKQIADGNLRIEYVSFTDNAAFYSVDALSGSADATNKIYFEQTSLMQDQITFEADDSGKIKPFKNANNVNGTLGGQIISIASPVNIQILTGTVFASSGTTLLASSIQNYQSLQIIGTKDYVFEDESFDLAPKNIEFNITDYSPLLSQQKERNINDLPSLFADKNFNNVQNFKYLPPINKIFDQSVDRKKADVINQNKIGNYVNGDGGFEASDDAKYPIPILEKDLSLLKKYGFMKSITFDPTSMANSLVSQIFEINGSTLQKLDVVEYGSYTYNEVFKQVFFVGKVLTDGNGCQTFVKMFTLVFE